MSLIPTSHLRPSQRLKSVFVLASGSLLLCILVCWFFTPQFVLWKGLNIPEAWSQPEINRAVDTLKQLENPRVRIENPSNQVINWRLLFPYIGHYLHFPKWLYLALPHIGCWLVAGYMTGLLWQKTNHWKWAFMGAGCLITSDWFFVSVGWLAYFDSWFVLGILLVSFSPSRIVVLTACLFTPWVDERFILALAGCMAVRWFYHCGWENRNHKDLFVDYLLIILLTIPYVACRLFLSFTEDHGSADYFRSVWNIMSQLPWFRFVEGFWAGFRAAWLFLVACGILVWKRGPWFASVATTLAIAGLLAIALVVAGDISRSMAMLLPVCLLGALWLASCQPRQARIVLPAVLAANLLLPAEHVITSFKEPIFYFYHEVQNWRNPPAYVNPITYVNEGMKLLNASHTAEARHFFGNAIQLNPRMPEAYLGRGAVSFAIQDFSGARLDFEYALQLRPQWADALYFRGLVLAKTGNPLAAIDDLRSALQVAPAGWAYQQECQSVLNQLGVK